MEFQYDLSGGSTAVIKRYQVAATKATPGVPVLVSVAAGSGLVVATTGGAANAVGVTVDTSGTYVTAQQTDNSDTERSVGVILNPFAVYSLLMSGAATEGTATVLYTAVSGGSDGLTIVFDITTDTPEMADGTAFCLAGANVGIARKITSNSGTTATFTVAWPRDVAAGDTFILAPYSPPAGITIDLTTLLTQANTSTAVASGAALKPIELKFNDASQEGRTNSYVNAILANHVMTAAMAD